VRSAADGFAALRELRRESPEILLSVLYMPGMSGFELLSVVRRRFPAIKVIAMSGAFSGNEVPLGVAADAFFQKGSSIASLLRIMDNLPRPERMSPRQPDPMEPIWVQEMGFHLFGKAYGLIGCPECLRTFPQALGSAISTICITECTHCRSSVRYAIVHSGDRTSGQAPRWDSSERMQDAVNLPQLYY
jgi:CheY-like chemotaxis protein